jgi:hypothetical protein
MLDKLTGIWRYLVPGIAVLLLIALIVFGVRGCQNDERAENNALVNTGQIIEREAGQSEVINHVENARDATDNPTGAELNVVCEKYDRNCKNGK